MHMTLLHMAITALIVASLPLSMVWISKDVNKYRKLVWVSVFLTFDLIVFGAFTRLTDSGLGCPDWPGCYGEANPFIAHEAIKAAEALMPTGPVTVFKAWVEMIHRYLAMGIGVLIVAMMCVAWYRWRKTRAAGYQPGYPTLLFFFVCLQGAFGAWTVTLKLQPVIVTIHLLLGMGLLSLLAWFGCRQNRIIAQPVSTLGSGTRVDTSSAVRADTAESVSISVPDPKVNTSSAVRWLALLSAAVVALQIALGGWVSTNYATLACSEFPLCQGQLVPEMDFEHGFHLWRELGKTAAGHYIPFQALTAIHWVHRNFALVVVLVLGLTAWRAWQVPGLKRLAQGIVAILAIQAFTGLATIYFNFPLAIAVLHNAGAALMVLLLTMLNYRAKYADQIQ